jgi:phage terminase large subunit-like protein
VSSLERKYYDPAGNAPPREGDYLDFGTYVIDWVEACCQHTIGDKAGTPLLLDEWQKEFIHEMYTMIRRGGVWQFVYQSILLMVPRGAGKSTLAAALALFALSTYSRQKGPRVLVAAATRDNAKHVYDPARDMVQQNIEFADMGIIANKNLIWCEKNNGELRRLSADGKGQFGHIPSFVVRDELHTWTTEKQVQLSEALMTALAKRRGAMALTTTTAGYDKTTILGELYDDAMRSPLLEKPKPGLFVLRDPARRFLFWCFEAPAGAAIDDPETWRLAHPSSWIDEDAIRAQLADPSISTDEFQRQWLNRWTKSRAAWLPLGLWGTLTGPRTIPDKGRIQIGVDASQTHDSTALSWAWAEPGKPVVVRAVVWSAREGAPCTYFHEGGTIDLREVRDYIINVLKLRYRVTEVAYDPRFFDTIARDLSDAGLKVVPVAQGSPAMKTAYNQFYIACRTSGIEHEDDKILADHVEGTAGRQTETGWVIDKLKNRDNDACISTCLAYSRARAYLARKGKTYITTREEPHDEEPIQDA